MRLPPLHELRVRVRGAGAGRRIRLQPVDTTVDWTLRATTNPDGVAVFPPLPRGRVQVREARSDSPPAVTVEIVKSTEIELESGG